MLSLLKLLAGLLPFLNTLADWFKRREEKAEARVVVGAEVAKAEAEATREAAVIVAEHRAHDATAQRLDKGTF